MTDKLLPCPFCGSEAISTHNSQDDIPGALSYFWHRCEGCGVETEGAVGLDDAVAVWNRRVDPPAVTS